jgi:Uma2 family endonuclease
MSVANKLTHECWPSRKSAAPARPRSFFTKKEMPTKVLILDQDLIREFIQDRHERGIDRDDEVWEGVYIVPPIATNPHQSLVTAWTVILFNVIMVEARGQVFSEANVSDRRVGWTRRFRGPDVVVLNGGRAVDCNTHWMGGPDFLIEVQSPGDETEEKIPFYSEISVQEPLIVHRDTRRLRLYRHNGTKLMQVKPSPFQGGKWLVSAVVPLAFRRKSCAAVLLPRFSAPTAYPEVGQSRGRDVRLSRPLSSH